MRSTSLTKWLAILVIALSNRAAAQPIVSSQLSTEERGSVQAIQPKKVSARVSTAGGTALFSDGKTYYPLTPVATQPVSVNSHPGKDGVCEQVDPEDRFFKVGRKISSQLPDQKGEKRFSNLPNTHSEKTPRPFSKRNQKSLEQGHRLAQVLSKKKRRFKNPTLERASHLSVATLKEDRIISRKAKEDFETLEKPYQDLAPKEFQRVFQRAEKSLNEALGDLAKDQTIEPAEKNRLQSLLFNARDKVTAAGAVLQEDLNQASGQNTNFLFGKRNHPFSASKGLSEIFGDKKPAPRTQEALVDRLALFHGLPKDQKKKVLSQLQLGQPLRVRGGGGTLGAVQFHNGEFFFKPSTQSSCGQFAHNILSQSLRSVSTLEFEAAWWFLQDGKIRRPPHWKSERVQVIHKIAQAFEQVRFRKLENLQTGDFLIYRNPFHPEGRILMIKSYDPRTFQSTVIEFDTKGRILREKPFSLVIQVKGYPGLYWRPGLFSLRLKPFHNPVCQYQIAQR